MAQHPHILKYMAPYSGICTRNFRNMQTYHPEYRFIVPWGTYSVLVETFSSFRGSDASALQKKRTFAPQLVLRPPSQGSMELRWECSESLQHYPVL